MSKEFTIDMSTPTRSPSGRKYSEMELGELKPQWYKAWRDYSYLEDDLISQCVNKIHTSPFEWPGTVIAHGCSKSVDKRFKRLKEVWQRKNPSITLSQKVRDELKQEAIKWANAEARRASLAGGMLDPFSYEYELSKIERKMRRTQWQPKLVKRVS